MTARFAEAFRRVGTNTWSVRPAFIDSLYTALGKSDAVVDCDSSMFSSLDRTWTQLDGRVVDHEGYGFPSWCCTRVEGIQLLRHLAREMDVKQPERLPEDAGDVTDPEDGPVWRWERPTVGGGV